MPKSDELLRILNSMNYRRRRCTEWRCEQIGGRPSDGVPSAFHRRNRGVRGAGVCSAHRRRPQPALGRGIAGSRCAAGRQATSDPTNPAPMSALRSFERASSRESREFDAEHVRLGARGKTVEQRAG